MAIAREAGRVEAGLDAAAAAFPRFAAFAVAGRDVEGRVAPRPAGDRARPDGVLPGDAPATPGWERPPPRAEGAPAGRRARRLALAARARLGRPGGGQGGSARGRVQRSAPYPSPRRAWGAGRGRANRGAPRAPPAWPSSWPILCSSPSGLPGTPGYRGTIAPPPAGVRRSAQSTNGHPPPELRAVAGRPVGRRSLRRLPSSSSSRRSRAATFSSRSGSRSPEAASSAPISRRARRRRR